LEDFVKSRGGSALELEILKAYFELDPEIRKKALEFFKNNVKLASALGPMLSHVIPFIDSASK
jgi:hypothetical protein